MNSFNIFLWLGEFHLVSFLVFERETWHNFFYQENSLKSTPKRRWWIGPWQVTGRMRLLWLPWIPASSLVQRPIRAVPWLQGPSWAHGWTEDLNCVTCDPGRLGHGCSQYVCWVTSVVFNSLRPHGLPQAPLSMGFSRQEFWRGLPFPSPGDLPDPGIEPRSPALQEESLLAEPPRKPMVESFQITSWFWAKPWPEMNSL